MSSTNTTTTPHRNALIGHPQNFWLHSTRTGFDLTHPTTPFPFPPSSSSTTTSSTTATFQTTTTPLTLSPPKTALLIIDMQNFFLSPSFGRSPLSSAGHRASTRLLRHAIPAARKAGIRIVWLNWGLSEGEVERMPPGVRRAFGFWSVGEGEEDEKEEEEDGGGGGWWFRNGNTGKGVKGAVSVDKFGGAGYRGGEEVLEQGRRGARYRGLGSECGSVEVEVDGEEEGGKKVVVDAGRLLMRGSWNAALYGPMNAAWEEGREKRDRPDVWINKNRMSGLWGGSTACQEFLEKEGITTLLFAGVNTDQCVGGTFMDAFSKGYDCVLLGDGCGTTSPEFAQQCFEFNAARTFGFCMSCEQFADGVEGMGK